MSATSPIPLAALSKRRTTTRRNSDIVNSVVGGQGYHHQAHRRTSSRSNSGDIGRFAGSTAISHHPQSQPLLPISFSSSPSSDPKPPLSPLVTSPRHKSSTLRSFNTSSTYVPSPSSSPSLRSNNYRTSSSLLIFFLFLLTLSSTSFLSLRRVESNQSSRWSLSYWKEWKDALKKDPDYLWPARVWKFGDDEILLETSNNRSGSDLSLGPGTTTSIEQIRLGGAGGDKLGSESSSKDQNQDKSSKQQIHQDFIRMVNVPNELMSEIDRKRTDEDLKRWLKNQKEKFLRELDEGKKGEGWTVSMGNSAGDLDSIACSIAFSYLSTLSSSSSPSQFVPLAQISQSDYYLRPENQQSLSDASISPQLHLLSPDDIQSRLSSKSLADLKSGLALVDHNALEPAFGILDDKKAQDDRVKAIIDHHADEGRHLHANPRVIKVPTGSCSSLVTSHFQYLSERPFLPPSLAKILLDAILLDTGDLKPIEVGGKATEDDNNAVGWLLPSILPLPSQAASSNSPKPVDSPADLTLFLGERHRNLGQKKHDVTTLSSRDILRRDYKEYEVFNWRYGLSTVPMALGRWINRAEDEDSAPSLSSSEEDPKGWSSVMNSIKEWMDERNLDLAGVLTTFQSRKGKHRRELLICVRKGDGKRDLRSVLQRIEGGKGLGPDGADDDEILKLRNWKAPKYARHAVRDSIRTEGAGGEEGDGFSDDNANSNGDGAAEAERLMGLRGFKKAVPKGFKAMVWRQKNQKATRKQVGPVVKTLVEKVGNKETSSSRL